MLQQALSWATRWVQNSCPFSWLQEPGCKELDSCCWPCTVRATGQWNIRRPKFQTHPAQKLSTCQKQE